MTGELIAAWAGSIFVTWVLSYLMGRTRGQKQGLCEAEQKAHRLYTATMKVQHGGTILVFYRAVMGDITEREMVGKLHDIRALRDRAEREAAEKLGNGGAW